MTITLAIGMARMAKRRAVIRRLPAVETLGSTTVICADKTGTLTENQMTVQSIWTPHGEIRATGTGYAPDVLLCDTDDAPVPVNANAALRWSLLAGACSNDAALVRDGTRWQIVGDPTEGAMLVVAAKAGFNPERLATTLPQVAAIPFSSERQYMATLHRDGTDHVVLAKGAVERMLDLCGTEMGADGALRPLDRATVLRATEMLTSRGLRVLATGMGAGAGTPDDFDENVIPGSLALTGLQAMSDPPRAAAASAVAACHSAGIAVKMITGDHAGTATAIATEVGLLDNTEPAAGSVLTGGGIGVLAQPIGVDAGVDEHLGVTLFDRNDFSGCQGGVDELFGATVLDIDSGCRQLCDVVSNGVGFVAVSVLDVDADVALQRCQGGRQCDVGAASGAVPVRVPAAGRDPETGCADSREALREVGQGRRHIPGVGQHERNTLVMKIVETHSLPPCWRMGLIVCVTRVSRVSR